jgi:hypothetical protein
MRNGSDENCVRIGECRWPKVLGRRQVNVMVKILDDTPPGVFELTSTDLPIAKSQHNGKSDEILTFSNYQGGTYQDGFEISFKLHPHLDYGFFVNDPDEPGLDNALAAKTIDSSGHCPAYGETWYGFSPTGLSQDRRTLTVENPNDSLQYFGFALFFAREEETEPSLCCDPIGDNENSQLWLS